MMVTKQDRPPVAGFNMSGSPVWTSRDDFGPGFRPPKSIRPRINRVRQNRQNRVVDRVLTIDLRRFAVPNRRECNLLLTTPQEHLTRATEFLKPMEDEAYRILHTQVRIEFDRTARSPRVADGKAKPQFATARLLANRFQ